MEEKQHNYRLGLFVIVTLVIAAVILFILGGQSLLAPKLTFETYFNKSVAGLEIGSPVKFRGIPLGTVTAIEGSETLYESEVPMEERKRYIVVRGKVTGSRERVNGWKRKIDEYVALGLRAQTQLVGITGQQYLALDLLDPKTYPPLPFDWKPEDFYIPSAPSLTGEIIAGAQKFIASLNEARIQDLANNLNKLVVTLDTKMEQIDVGALSAETIGLIKDARSMVRDVDHVVTAAPIAEAAKNFSSASARLDRVLADPGVTQTVENTAALTARLRALAESGELDRVLRDLDEAVKRANALLADNQYDVRVIIQDLRIIAANVRVLSETLKRYPAGALLSGPPEKIEHQDKESK